MENKCSKYEQLFTFSDDETLQKHLSECAECRQEHEAFEKVSSLLDEVKLYYYAKRKKQNTRLRAACAVIFLMLSMFSITVSMNGEDLVDTLKYGNTLSAEDFGFPVDSDGLLMVDNE